ncbi:MAG: hypothetical protein U0166_18220 [Acidobacteriota bacterium]
MLPLLALEQLDLTSTELVASTDGASVRFGRGLSCAELGYLRSLLLRAISR